MMIPMPLAAPLALSSKPTLVSYDQLTEVVSKLVEAAQASENERAPLQFNQGATLVAGALTEKGRFSWTFPAATDGTYKIYKHAYGNDYELKVEVSAAGKNVISSQNDESATFTAVKGTRYTVTLVNIGASTFAGIALYKTQNGQKHPYRSMSKAANVMSKSIETGMKDGFKVPINSPSVLGAVIPANGTYNRATPKAASWSTILTADVKAGGFRLSVVDKDKAVLQDDNGESEDCVCVFRNQVVEAGSIKILNTTDKAIFALSVVLTAR